MVRSSTNSIPLWGIFTILRSSGTTRRHRSPGWLGETTATVVGRQSIFLVAKQTALDTYTQSYQFWLRAAVVATDLLAFGGFIAIPLSSLQRGEASGWLIILASAGFFGISSRKTGAYDVSSVAALRAAAMSTIRIGLLISVVFGISYWYFERQGGEKVIAAGVTATLLAAVSRLICLAISCLDAKRSCERLGLVGSAKALDRLSDSVPLSSARVVGCMTVGECAPHRFSHLEIDTAHQPNDLRLHCCGADAFDRVVILGAGLDEATLKTVLTQLEHIQCEIVLAPIMTTLFERGGMLDPHNCVCLRGPVIAPMQRLLKRALDLSIATTLLVVLAPILLTIALLIRRERYRASSVQTDPLGSE